MQFSARKETMGKRFSYRRLRRKGNYLVWSRRTRNSSLRSKSSAAARSICPAVSGSECLKSGIAFDFAKLNHLLAEMCLPEFDGFDSSIGCRILRRALMNQLFTCSSVRFV